MKGKINLNESTIIGNLCTATVACLHKFKNTTVGAWEVKELVVVVMAEIVKWRGHGYPENQGARDCFDFIARSVPAVRAKIHMVDQTVSDSCIEEFVKAVWKVFSAAMRGGAPPKRNRSVTPPASAATASPPILCCVCDGRPRAQAFLGGDRRPALTTEVRDLYACSDEELRLRNASPPPPPNQAPQPAAVPLHHRVAP